VSVRPDREVCFVTPNGEVLDFLMYDEENVPVPMDVVHDDYASMSALLTVQFAEPLSNKRLKIQ
jgi:hypothetical protein